MTIIPLFSVLHIDQSSTSKFTQKSLQLCRQLKFSNQLQNTIYKKSTI